MCDINIENIKKTIIEEGGEKSYPLGLSDAFFVRLCNAVLTELECSVLCQRSEGVKNSSIARTLGVTRQASSKKYHIAIEKLLNASELNLYFNINLCGRLHKEGVYDLDSLKGRFEELSYTCLSPSEVREVASLLGLIIPSPGVFDIHRYKEDLKRRLSKAGGFFYLPFDRFDEAFEYSTHSVDAIKRSMSLYKSSGNNITNRTIETFQKLTDIELCKKFTKAEREMLSSINIIRLGETVTYYDYLKLIALEYSKYDITRLFKKYRPDYLPSAPLTDEQITVIDSVKRTCSPFKYLTDPTDHMVAKLFFSLAPEYISELESDPAYVLPDEKVDLIRNACLLSVILSDEDAERCAALGIMYIPDLRIVTKSDLAMISEDELDAMNVNTDFSLDTAKQAFFSVFNNLNRIEKECFFIIKRGKNGDEMSLSVKSVLNRVGALSINGAENIYSMWRKVYFDKTLSIKQVLSLAPVM